MNQLKEQIVSLTVDLEDKEKTYELLQKKLTIERKDVSQLEEKIHEKYERLLQAERAKHAEEMESIKLQSQNVRRKR